MRRRFFLIAGAIFAGAVAPATAGTPGYYINGDVGASFLPNLHLNDAARGVQREHFDTGIAAGGAIGYDTGDGVRLEFDSLYQNSSLTRLSGVAANGHISSTSLIANAAVDLLPQSPVTPYVGAGLGFQNVGGQVNSLRGRAFKPAYQAEAGLRDDLTDQMSLFGEYRFGQSESVKLRSATDSANQHFSDHVVLAGLSYKFGQ